MLQFKNSNKVMETGNHFKNGDIPKIHKSKGNFLFLALVIAFATTSCSEEHTTQIFYAHGIYSWYSADPSGLDLAKVENHINSFNLPSSPVIYTGTGKSESAAVADAESKAQKDIALWLAKFKREDFEMLGLHSSTRFAWRVLNGDDAIAGEFKWNMPN
jgi:hypothetical protein